MEESPHAVTQKSYSRCLRSPDFLPRFYELLLASDPSIPPMFGETDFARQHKLLQHALGLLLSYGNHPDDALLERLAARHSKAAIDVPPRLYGGFVESLLSAVREFDPDFCDATESAWRVALRPGVEFMQSRYDP
jgi:hemoglobin-like flavoprotein